MSRKDAEGLPAERDPLLGAERMVTDPRISPAQAAVVLEVTVAQVYRLVRLGRLPTHGPPKASWQLLLSEVEGLRDRGEAITLKEAARLLRCTTDDVRRHIVDGKLTDVPDSRRPVYLREVQALAEALNVPGKRQQPRRRSSPPAGYMNTKEVPRLLGLSPSRIRQLAAVGRIPAQRDEVGNYWYKPEQLKMVRRARLAADAHAFGEVVDVRTTPHLQ